MAEVVERLKDLSGIISSLLVLADEKFSILPLNPVIHEQLWPVAAILGLVAGFGTRQFAKNTGRLFLGAICLGLAFLTVILILILVRAGSGHGVSLGARVAYLSFFLLSAAQSAGSGAHKHRVPQKGKLSAARSREARLALRASHETGCR